MALTDLSDEELRTKLSAAELGSKRAATAQAILRRRKAERLNEWLKRHSWLAALATIVGSVAFFFQGKIRRSERKN
jgi:hypothetical protein